MTLTAILIVVVSTLLVTFHASCSESGLEPFKPRTSSPLNGLPLTDPSSSLPCILAVKVENHPEARPQSGLDQAEVIYEELVEGGVTRFVAVYLDEDVPEIGPVRSARPMDVDLLEYLDPLFAVSGGSSEVMRIIGDSSLEYVSEAVDETIDYFFRTRDRRAPHNLYTSTSLLREYCANAGHGGRQWDEDIFRFGEPGQSDACDSLKVRYPASCAVSYSYDASSRRYLRSMAGTPHLDKISGRQLAPATVIIQYVELEDTGVRDVAGDLSPDAVVVGCGNGLVFSGGKVFHTTWEKSSSSQRAVFLSEEGEEITITPGQVWVHLIPASITVEY